MVSVDEHTQIGIEIVSQGVKLSEQLLLKVLESLIEKLGENKKEQNFVIKDNTKEGKQKITDLMNKHQEGVVALDENITKQQLNDYQKELKKMGVDFSVVKSGKDSYSFFFSSQQANVIEKALKNIVERKSNVLENEQVKNLQLDLNVLKKEMPKEKVLEVKDLYDKTALPEKEVKINTLNEQLNRLSSKEKLLFSKLKELDDLKRTLYVEEVKRVENLYNQSNNRGKEEPAKATEAAIDNSQKNNDKTNTLSEQNKSLSPEEKLENILNQLTPKEQTLFSKLNDAEIESLDNFFADRSTDEKSKALQNAKVDFSKDEIQKVYKLHGENVFSGTGRAPEGFLHADKVSAIIDNQKRREKQIEKPKSSSIFSVQGVKEIDAKIKAEQKDKDQVKTRKPSIER